MEKEIINSLINEIKSLRKSIFLSNQNFGDPNQRLERLEKKFDSLIAEMKDKKNLNREKRWSQN